ncbi:MAG: two-component regulator propeller domain-containing protein [Saprospiraceae bacterium]
MRNGFQLDSFRFIPYLLVGLFLQIHFVAFSQNFEFERIPNELGLSQNLISALWQDRQGFIWVGTKDGLNRFDGYHFEVFQHDPFDSTSISDNNIKSILEDSQGRFWIATENGLNLMNREKKVFERLYSKGKIEEGAPAILHDHPGLSSGDIQSLMEDRDGNIWVGTLPGEVVKIELPPGAETFDRARFTVFWPTAESNSLWGNGIKIMVQDVEGTIWVHSKDQLCLIQPMEDGDYLIKRLHWEDFDPQWPNYRQEDFLNGHPDYVG